jgi:hypothetical protein
MKKSCASSWLFTQTKKNLCEYLYATDSHIHLRYSYFIFKHKFPLQTKQVLFFHAFNKFCRNCTPSSAILASVLACSSSELTSEAMNILDNWKDAWGGG